MAWVTITDARIAANKPGDTGLVTDIRDDLNYLKAAADDVGYVTASNLYDDFIGLALDTTQWRALTGAGTGAPSWAAMPDHYISFDQNSVDCGIQADTTKNKMRFDLDRDHTIRMLARAGKATAAGDQDILFGFQDVTVVDNAMFSTYNSCIGFVKGTGANTIKAYCSKTAGNNVTVADNLSDWRNWMKLRIDITFSGATKKVEFWVDDVSVGSTTDTTKIPVVEIVPTMGAGNGSGARTTKCDYAKFFWVAQPLSN